MEREIVVKGRMISPTTVELAEPLLGEIEDVEVVARVTDASASAGAESLIDFLRRIPTGGRMKEDIDHQTAHERASWGE